MAIAWFLCSYKRRSHPTRVNRYCVMDDFTSDLRAEQGDWSETEIENNLAVVKVRASTSLLERIGTTPGFLPLADRSAALAQMTPTRTKPRYDPVTDTVVFDGPPQPVKSLEQVDRDVRDG